MQDHNFELSVNTGFLVNRYTDPDQWVKLVANFININKVQFTADLINPSLPESLIKKKVHETKTCLDDNGVEVTSSFTGAFTRLNNLTHPDQDFREYYVDWFKKFADITADLDSKYLGSHFAILTQQDLEDPDRRKFLRKQAIKSWHEIASHAKNRGIEEIFWEPMSISREFGETIDEAIDLNNELNKNSPLPFSMCLDVDHGDLESPNPEDIDPYAWINQCKDGFDMIHLKQSYSNKGGHWPFIAEHNKKGNIVPSKILDAIRKTSPRNVQLVLELSFKERQPADRLAAEHVKESVDFWQNSL
jgi:sugar phosphate isomerase/epimerase|tara:strand:- start:2904 stop:3815 length:912 start_codon:yes stop_codon:yes gene_type:complete